MSADRKLTEEDIRSWLGERHVSPEIVDRVVRLNPNVLEGERLRGIHYKHIGDPRFWCGHIGKAAFLARFGSDAFAKLESRDITKRGRRVYVTRQACERFRSAEAA